LVDSEHPLLVHHRQATERIATNLFLLFPEGKPPDTYRRQKSDLQRIEYEHLNYFDTGEWLHEQLTRFGLRGYLFLPPPGVFHSWGSRDATIFLNNITERLPWFDLNKYLPDILKIYPQEAIVPVNCLSFRTSDGSVPAQWAVVGRGAGVKVNAVEDGLQLQIELPDGVNRYFGLESSSFSDPPSHALEAVISPSTAYRVTWDVTFNSKVTAMIWIIEYDDKERLCHHTRYCQCGSADLAFFSSAKTKTFRLFFRLTGSGSMLIRSLKIESAHSLVVDREKAIKPFFPSINHYKKKKKGVILLSADALRADFLNLLRQECALDQVPALSDFIGSSSMPEVAYSTAPWTLPSHMSMFTGLYPHQHGYGVDFKVGKPYPMPVHLPFLPEYLARKGVKSYGFHNGGVMDANRGFGYGWASYNGSHPGDVDNPIHEFIRSFSDMEDGYFAFIHTYAIHNYYKESGTPLALDFLNTHERRYLNSLISEWGNLRWMMAENLKLGRVADVKTRRVVQKLYLGAVLHFENIFKQLIEFLVSMDSYDQTSIILTSDHGESLGEQRRGIQHWSHMTINVHDENIRVPFYIKNASSREVNIPNIFSLAGLPRLILSMFGIEPGEFKETDQDWLFSTGTTDQFGQEWESKIPAEGRVYRSVLFNKDESYFLSGRDFQVEYLHDRVRDTVIDAREMNEGLLNRINDNVRRFTGAIATGATGSPSLEILGDDVVRMMRDLGYVE
jgi:hypothetical protein